MTKQLTAREQEIGVGTKLQYMADNKTVQVTDVNRDEDSGLILNLWVTTQKDTDPVFADSDLVPADAFGELVILSGIKYGSPEDEEGNEWYAPEGESW